MSDALELLREDVWSLRSYVRAEFRALLAIIDRDKENQLMATLADVQTRVTELQSDEGSVKQALNDLKAKVDSGSGVTTADLDNLSATLDGVHSQLAADVAAVEPTADNSGGTPTGGGTPLPGA